MKSVSYSCTPRKNEEGRLTTMHENCTGTVFGPRGGVKRNGCRCDCHAAKDFSKTEIELPARFFIATDGCFLRSVLAFGRETKCEHGETVPRCMTCGGVWTRKRPLRFLPRKKQWVCAGPQSCHRSDENRKKVSA